jgi:tRNA-splicing ligase RtcB
VSDDTDDTIRSRYEWERIVRRCRLNPLTKYVGMMEQISKRLMNWASILEDNTREQAVTTEHDAVHPPAPGADARRPPRQGRHRRLGHPDARRDHPGRGRRGHRLRHDGRPHPVHRERPARRPAAARGHQRRVPLSAGKYNQSSSTRRDEPRAIASWRARRLRAGRGHRPELALQLGSLGSGNHFIEVSLDEERPRLAVPALRLPRRRQQARHEAHQGRPGAVREAVDLAARPDLAYLVEGDDRSSGPTWRRCGGRSGSPT